MHGLARLIPGAALLIFLIRRGTKITCGVVSRLCLRFFGPMEFSNNSQHREELIFAACIFLCTNISTLSGKTIDQYCANAGIATATMHKFDGEPLLVRSDNDSRR